MLIYGLILAGGEGRRFGGTDKAFLPLEGRCLLDRVADRFSPQLAGMAISANGDARRFARFGYDVLPDQGAARLGPMAGVAAGLSWLAGQGGTHLATVPVDAPFLPCDLVARLVDAAMGAPAGLAVADCGGRIHPTCALWPLSIAPALTAALAAGERRIGQWALAQGAARAVFAETTPDAFMNLNTPDDLAAAERALRAN